MNASDPLAAALARVQAMVAKHDRERWQDDRLFELLDKPMVKRRRRK